MEQEIKETIVKKIDKKDINELYRDEDIKEAAIIIKNGGLVAFPTETVYGLGANALMPEAAKKIYAAKGRPSDNPLIVHISRTEDVKDIANDIPELFYTLANKFWPGPMTVVLKKKNIIPDATSGGLDTVAIRLPESNIARALIEVSGVPIAAPSANTSGRPSPTKASHVFADMNSKIEMIIDGGEVGIGVESTIVDLTENTPTLLRPGAITFEMLRDVCGNVNIDPAIEHLLSTGEAPKAPGMKYKHYAPKADMKMLRGKEREVLSYLKSQIMESELETAVLTVDEHKSDLLSFIKENKKDNVKLLSLGSSKDMSSIAHNLFDVLRKCDDLGVKNIISESFDESGIGRAVMNRLKKAAGFNIIDL